MRQLSRTSRSFLLLLLIVLATVYTALVLFKVQRNYIATNATVAQSNSKKLTSTIDTKEWKVYQDNVFPLSFAVPIDWRVTHFVNEDGTHDFTVRPKGTLPPVTILVSKTGFAGTEGLQATEIITDNNYNGIMIADSVYGIKSGEYYYTFDGTLTPNFLSELKAIINTVQFN